MASERDELLIFKPMRGTSSVCYRANGAATQVDDAGWPGGVACKSLLVISRSRESDDSQDSDEGGVGKLFPEPAQHDP